MSRLYIVERVTGRKTRGLQMEEIDCNMSNIFMSLKQQEETNWRYFFPSLYKFKRKFLLKYCVAINLLLLEVNYSQTLS